MLARCKRSIKRIHKERKTIMAKRVGKYTATVDRIISDYKNYSTPRILLSNVFASDGYLFRDHLWITPRKKDILKCSEGDQIKFFATEYNYIDVNTGKQTKRGLKHIRSIEHEKSGK